MTPALPSEFWQGIDEFNQGQFYACHDTLEAIWLEAAEPEKKFYQGILQIAVALYHLGNQNWRGAVILLGEGLQRLQSYHPDYGGIEVSQFAAEAHTLLVGLQTAGAERVGEVHLVLVRDQGLTPVPDGALVLPRPLIHKTLDSETSVNF